MQSKKRSNRTYLITLLLVAAFSIIFVAVMGFLNYRTTAISLEEQVIGRVSKDYVESMETAISFGKSFRNYYGTGDIFDSFKGQVEGPRPFIIDADGELLYYAAEEADADGSAIRSFLGSREFRRDFPGSAEETKAEYTKISSGIQRAIFVPIHEDEEVIGYFGSIYTNAIFSEGFMKLLKELAVMTAVYILIVFFALYIVFHQIMKRSGKLEAARSRIKALSIVIMAVGILVLSASSIYSYQRDYRLRLKSSVRTTLHNLESKIEHVSDQGVNLRELGDLRKYIKTNVSSLEMLRAVRISDRISEVTRTDEESDIITYSFNSGGDQALYLEAELSDEATNREMRSIILVLMSTLAILLIFAFELFNVVELLSVKAISGEGDAGGTFSEKQISLALRFTGFLCATAEYMCVPYAAMMIRASGESLLGLTVGMTAALPLTMEGIAQMIGMLIMPKFTKKFNVRTVLIVSTIVMAACNISAFIHGSAMVIVICRLIAGLAYSGFKQVSNFLITSGYETEEGRSENISQDNAGLLAGATCGAGLGAILSANTGYGSTFLFSAILFAVYMLFTLGVIPWKSLAAKAAEEESKPVQIKNVLKMFLSPEMLLFVIVVGIPLNIGVMLCVTLIPAICQSHGISAVMLSYCYIANGLAGIYLGPALVTAAKKRFGLGRSIAFAFALTAAGIFILHIPPVVLMIVITSMILGFLDGFSTPLSTDMFMSLKTVKTAVDESTSLIFYVVITYILLTFAPVVAELLLLPGKGALSPMMIAAVAYAAAAVVLVFMRERE